MKLWNANALRWAMVPAALVVLSACKSASNPPPPETTSSVVYAEGVPGGVYVQTVKATARVSYVDKEERKVTLLQSDGKKTVFKAGPEIRNFDQIRVGDNVEMTRAEEVVLRMAGDTAPYTGRDGAAAMVALAPIGAKPGILLADTVQMTTTVTAIDHAGHRATLRFPDGRTETFPVRADVDLTKRRVGEEVVVRSTVAVVIEVKTPVK